VGPVEISAVIFLCIFAGAILGMWLKGALPKQHLNAETQDVVKLGAGLIGTMAALLLGLLVASAKSAYDTRGTELTQMAANIILLDRALAHYGPETGEMRGMLKTAVSRIIDQVWPKNGKQASFYQAGLDNVFDQVQQLDPHSGAQRELQSEAESILINVGQMRLLLFAQSGTSISTPFLVVVVFWLSTLFVSFGLFAPRNATALVTLLVASVSVAGALFLILELDYPFSGLIQISSEPLRNALSVIGR
jgi:hypothetical protein